MENRAWLTLVFIRNRIETAKSCFRKFVLRQFSISPVGAGLKAFRPSDFTSLSTTPQKKPPRKGNRADGEIARRRSGRGACVLPGCCVVLWSFLWSLIRGKAKWFPCGRQRAGESTRTPLISPEKLALPRPARGAPLASSLAGFFRETGRQWGPHPRTSPCAPVWPTASAYGYFCPREE